MLSHISVLVPELPEAELLTSWLRRIDTARHYTNFGPLNAELTNRLASAVDALRPSESPAKAVTFANCTSALIAWLRSIVGCSGGLVLIPGITFIATAQAVLSSGNRLAIADVAPNTWLLTPEMARAAIDDLKARTPGQRLAAVIPVAAYGTPCDTDAWDRFTEETGIPVLIDAAGAFGNQPLGATTDLAISLHATKSLGAGEGGALLSRVPNRAELFIQASNFGINPHTGLVDHPGENGKLSEYHAAVGLAALETWPDQARRRQQAMRHYTDLLIDHCPAITLPTRPGDGTYTLLPVLLPPHADARQTLDHLAEHNIQTRRWYCPPIHHHPLFSQALRISDLPQCEALSRRLLGLPFHLRMSADDRQRVVTTLARLL